MERARKSSAKQHSVAVVVADHASVFELAVPCEVFGLDRSDMGMPTYRFMVCGLHDGPHSTKGDLFTIETPYTLADAETADTIIVPAWDVNQPTSPELCAVLRRAHARGVRIASLCSGAFVLAAAGLLDGRRATTHWMWAPELARRFPLIDVDPSVLYIDEGNVLTSAGTAAAIDLCLYMVRQDHGAEVANVFARRMIVPPHREGGQAQFVEAPISACDCDELAATLDWAVHHLDQDLTVAQLAERARHVTADVRAAVLRGHRHDAVAVAAPATRARGAAHAREHRPLRRSRRGSMWVRRGVDVAHALPSCHRHDTAGLPRLLPRRLTAGRPRDWAIGRGMRRRVPNPGSVAAVVVG